MLKLIPMVDPITMVDPLPMVDALLMADSIPMVDPMPIVEFPNLAFSHFLRRMSKELLPLVSRKSPDPLLQYQLLLQ